MEPDRELMLRLQRESAERKALVRQIVQEAGRDDVLREYDKAMWEIETGVAQAHSTWAALSPPQRRVMIALYEGRELRRAGGTRFSAISIETGARQDIRDICQPGTVTALRQRRLLDMNRLSDKGRLVVKRAAGLGEKGEDNERS